ncbi:hypothetical protein BC831DRAFT_516837 [Entophlyctis helioformis]|nr:hypothetical protein BC831DRAFT_516837 [Entophlyctis helioformis]
MAAMPKFATPGLHAVNVGLDEVSGRIAALGDFNGDRMLESQGVQLTITNVIPGDFNYDGKLDFVLFGQLDPGRTKDVDLYFQLFLGDGHGSAEGMPNKNVAEISQPFIVDYDGTMVPSLMGHVRGEPNVLSVWTFNTTSLEFDSSVVEPQAEENAIYQIHTRARLWISMATAWQDANNHMTYQIWVNTKTDGFVFARQEALPHATDQISFADMDADGTMDMVFSTCTVGIPCTINIAYNQQIGLCSDDSTSPCRDPHDLCVADNGFAFDLTSASPRYTSFVVTDMFPNDVVYVKDLTFNGVKPSFLRIGDYNNDGYPDILFLSTSMVNFGQITVRLLQSVPCDNKCKTEWKRNGARSFVPVTDGLAPLDSFRDALIASASFMDIGEDGTLDILLSVRELNDTDRTFSFVNNYYNDAFFLKAMVLNGVCNEWCPGEHPFPDPKPYGVNYAGGTFKPMHTPNILFGLGRTNNYIEDLFVGVSRRKAQHVAAYHGVIPNSQLVIVPYEASQAAGPDSWKLELYMNPSSSSLALLVVLVGSLLLLGGIAQTDAALQGKFLRMANTLEPPPIERAQGFDRLLELGEWGAEVEMSIPGMSQDEVQNLRSQFHALRGRDADERTDQARNAEEEWMDNPGNVPSTNQDDGTHLDMLVGLLVGFFMGILVLFWVKEANMYNRRAATGPVHRLLGIVTGLVINLAFGMLRM